MQMNHSVGGTQQTGRWEHAVLHCLRQPFLSYKAFTMAFTSDITGEYSEGLTLTLTSSSHRFLGGITKVVFSSVM